MAKMSTRPLPPKQRVNQFGKLLYMLGCSSNATVTRAGFSWPDLKDIEAAEKARIAREKIRRSPRIMYLPRKSKRSRTTMWTRRRRPRRRLDC